MNVDEESDNKLFIDNQIYDKTRQFIHKASFVHQPNEWSNTLYSFILEKADIREIRIVFKLSKLYSKK